MRVVPEKNRSLTIVNREIEFGKRIDVWGWLFGCWHKNLSRPFSQGRSSYIVCLDCGARKHFDAQSLKTYGTYYYPPEVWSSNGI